MGGESERVRGERRVREGEMRWEGGRESERGRVREGEGEMGGKERERKGGPD